MITKAVNDWIRKVEKGNYSSWDIMEEFVQVSRYLTKEEMVQVKKRLASNIKH